jgi:hypothetical protein
LALALHPRSYSADASLEILPNRTNVPATIHPDLVGHAPQWISAEFELMQSPTVIKPVIDELQLNVKWGRKYNNGEPLSTKETFSMLTGRLYVFARRSTAVIEISAFSDDPAESAEIANAISQSYRSQVISEHRPVSVGILNFARLPTKAIRPNIPFGIAWTFVRALIFALLAGVIARGITIVASRKLPKPPPPLPHESENKSVRRFQKY